MGSVTGQGGTSLTSLTLPSSYLQVLLCHTRSNTHTHTHARGGTRDARLLAVHTYTRTYTIGTRLDEKRNGRMNSGQQAERRARFPSGKWRDEVVCYEAFSRRETFRRSL